MDTFSLGILTLLVVALLTVLIIFLFRRHQGNADISTPIQNLTQAIQQNQAQTAVLAEKLTRLEPMTQSVSNVQIELRGLSERILNVEQNQNQYWDPSLRSGWHSVSDCFTEFTLNKVNVFAMTRETCSMY